MVGRALGLVGEVLVVRSLPPETYGHVALAYTVATALGGLTLLGVPDGVTRLLQVDSEPGRRSRLVAGGYAIAFVGSVVGVAALLALRFELGALLEDPELPRLVVAFVPFLLAVPVARVSFAALRGFKRTGRAVLARNFVARVGALAAFGVASLVGRPLLGAVVYWTAFPVVMGLVALAFVRRDLPPASPVDRLPDRDTLHELWSFSWPLAVGASVFLVLSHLDVLMIGYFLEPRDVGYYRAVQPLRQVTTFVVGSFTFLFLPLATEYYADGDLGGLEDLYATSTKWIAAATFPPVLVVTLFAPSVVRVLYGGEYLPAAAPLAVLVGGLFVRALVGLDGDVVKAIDRPRVELVSATVGVVANFGLDVVLIPRFGIVGAAVATAVGYGVYNAIEVGTIYATARIHPFSRALMAPLVPTAVVGVLLRRFAFDGPTGLAGLAGVGLLVSVALVVSMVATGWFDAADAFLLEQIEDGTGLDLSRLRAFVVDD